jgi:hypothetical protein
MDEREKSARGLIEQLANSARKHDDMAKEAGKLASELIGKKKNCEKRARLLRLSVDMLVGMLAATTPEVREDYRLRGKEAYVASTKINT